MKKRIVLLVFAFLLMAVNAFAQGNCNMTGSSPSGGLYFYKALIGSGTDDSPYLFANTGRKLYFGTNGNTVPKMVIDTAGNVGIGTTAPQTSLHVNGDITLGDNSPNPSIKFIHMGSNSTWLSLSGGSDTNHGAVLNLIGSSSGFLPGSMWLSAGVTGGFIFSTTDNTGSNVRMVMLNNGNVGIGPISPGYPLDVNGELMVRSGSIRSGLRTDFKLILQGDRNMVLYDNNVAVWSSGTQTSDLRLKKNISQITGVLPQVMQLNAVRFNWIDASWGNQTEIGVIAQEVEKFYPEIVNTDKKSGYKLVQYEKLTPILIEAVKELKTENDAYKAKLQRLEDKLERLERKIK